MCEAEGELLSRTDETENIGWKKRADGELMKIVLIHGQSHRGSTWNVANILLQELKGEKEVEEFFLPRDLNHFCLGCFRCLEGREMCPFWEEKRLLDRAVREADLLIFTTPNYCMMPSAPMKAFLDLNFVNWMAHKPYEEMFHKRAVVISTAAGAGAGKAAALVADNLENWGIPKVLTYGVSVNAMGFHMISEKKKEKIKKDMSRLARKLSSHKKVKAGIRLRFRFWFYGSLQKANWGASQSEGILEKQRLAYRNKALEVTMKTVVLLYDTCCIYEIVILNYFLKVTGKDVSFVSLDGGKVTAMEGYSIQAEASLGEVKKEEVELLIVPGGEISKIDHKEVWDLIAAVHKNKQIVAGICAGVDVLEHAGILEEIVSTHSADLDVAVSDHVVTARANGYVDFAIEVAKEMDLFEDEADLQETISFWKEHRRAE